VARTIILGGSGFVGSHVAELLARKDEVVVVTRSRTKERNLTTFREHLAGVELADVTKWSELRRVLEERPFDRILHFAGQFTTYESFDRPRHDLDVNAVSTLRILEWMRKRKSKVRFLLGSTFWAVGRPATLPVDETAACFPLANYPAHRLLAEHYCSIYRNVFDLDALVVRFTNGYGPREQCDNPKKAALNFLIMKAVRGEPFPIYEKGDFFRDYIFATDMATAAATVLERGHAGQLYFAGTGNKAYFKDLAEYIREFTGTPYHFVPSPDYHKRINVGDFVINPAKLAALGWTAKVSPREGVRLTVEYCRNLLAASHPET
jgi:UDP-glucose 4-epimerase